MAVLHCVSGHEHLACDATRQPWTIALVAVGGSMWPGLATVLGRENAVVRQVDAGVVYRPRSVLSQVGVAEAGVGSASSRSCQVLPPSSEVQIQTWFL